jgi:hypothetical protein
LGTPPPLLIAGSVIRAATAVLVEPKVKEYRGSDPVSFVLSLNLHRRHLDESQRAIWWRRLANMKVGGESFGKFAE